jgi:hypothetical protein
MIQNNLDPEAAENPAELVVYGGIGRAQMGVQDSCTNCRGGADLGSQIWGRSKNSGNFYSDPKSRGMIGSTRQVSPYGKIALQTVYPKSGTGRADACGVG